MRKDKLSSFQAKKQKLLKIKKIIENYQLFWKMVREGKEFGPATKTIDAVETINEIWELVKDE